MAQLPDVPVEPAQLSAAFEAFSLDGGNPLDEYRAWVTNALREECVRRQQDHLMGQAADEVKAQLVAYQARLP